ncbi:MAG TPA: hypothetical protein VNY51_09940 [Candidatus Dormibacteraeota bacterium]|jgi:hypothetical protein|nr:hypothetical protein [Candidatus Dormibacteraeota bacterium]
MLRRVDFIFFLSIAALLVLAAWAQLSAQQQSVPSGGASSAQHVQKATPAAPSHDAGSVVNGVYRNPSFGVTCKIPPAWVLRTDEMNAPDDEATTAHAAKSATNTDTAHAGHVLLAAFSRPPEARGEDVNSSILIAAESVAAYPGLKDAAQYFGPVSEVAKAQGFEIDGEPYEFAVGTKIVVRADFQKNVGTRVMRQSTLVILVRGSAVSFTFISGTEDEVEQLIGGLSFTAAQKPQSH